MEICHGFIPVLPNDIMVLYHRQIILGTQPSYVCQKNRHIELDTLIISAPVFHLRQNKDLYFSRTWLDNSLQFSKFPVSTGLEKKLSVLWLMRQAGGADGSFEVDFCIHH